MGYLSSRLYPLLPVGLQNIGISLFGLLWKHRRFGGIYAKEYTAFKQREVYSKEQWDAYQTQQLRHLLAIASKNVGYYQSLFLQKGITANFIESITLDDLIKLPLLEKNHLRTLGTTTLLSTHIEKGGIWVASSGSTGTPTNIRYSRKMQQRYAAAHEARCRNWAGVNNTNSRGMIGGRRVVPEGDNNGPFFRYNFIERQVYFSAYHISSKTAHSYVEAMSKHQIDYMTGYAMSNYFLARFIEEQDLQAPKLKAVITSSEKLTLEMRETFQRVYGCNTYDGYSGVEACGMITECEQGSLHISPDVGIIELIKEDGSYARPGEIGEAVCTGLLNYDQPLIRYRIGDLLKLSINQHCECGRQMPIVDEIIGRVEDTVIGKDGREMVRFHGIFINIPTIIEGQIIQHTLEDFEINIVCANPLTPAEKTTITQRMESQLGKIHLTINETKSIPRNQNGKFKSVISHVKRTT